MHPLSHKSYTQEIIFFIASMSHGSPPKWTGIITLGSLLSFLAFISLDFNFSIQILKVSLSISTKSIFASQYNAQFELATKLIGEVHTASPL